MAGEKLKPCPFCGEDVLDVSKDKYYRVNCWICESQGPPCRRRRDAIAFWNTRHTAGTAGEES